MYIIRELKYSIVNLFRWLPVVWKDRDWDYMYLFEMMEYKIKNMERYFNEHGHYIGCEKQAEEMKVARLILKRLIDNKYEDKEYDIFNEKWGKTDINVDADGYINITHEKAKTEEDKIQCRNDLFKASKISYNAMKRDKDYLFDFMKRNVIKWSD